MTRPLVSVITPTWQRPELLAACIQNVRLQTYRPLEHVIVSDGPDRETSRVALDALDCGARLDPSRDVAMRYVVLGRNWTSFLIDSFAAAPMIVGQLIASGDYQTWLADDEWAELDHIQTLVTALEDAGADLSYGRVRMYWNGQRPEQGYDIGADPPQYGQITNVLYRTDLLKRGLHPFGAGMSPDWACISQWLDAGARWAYVNRVTLTHRIDH
jgi:glycosyltransferase involved in cell wall biosynthesis